jgi:hypothetical protein
MKVDMNKISFKEYLERRKQLYENADEIRKAENNIYCYNLPNPEEYHIKHIEDALELCTVNKDNFREQWHCQREMIQWSHEPYGRDYSKLLTRYNKFAKDPVYIKRLKDVYEHGGRTWGYIWKQTKEAADEGRFVSFWQYTIAHQDTRGSWRHWWDALTYDAKFKVGDIVELRSHATRNNVFYEFIHQYDSKYKYLRSIFRLEFLDIKKKPLMVIAYDQKKPDRTYSYKKSAGSHRIITILPVGSTKVYYIPEQFLKISRKKAVKDAKKK